MAVRLNKYLAERGIASRRACDRLIAERRVSVNGRVVDEAGTKVEERDRVAVDGRPVGGRERPVYFVLNKPVGVITTLDDPEGRRTIKQLLPRGARVYPVGRLDADTSGLLLLTNDGELAHKLMHPRYGVHKVYRVRLAAEPRADQLRRMAAGVRFDRDAVSAPARVRRIDPGFDAIMIEVIVHEGRFRQVRRMCEAVGLEVTGLHRVGYGPLSLGPLARGMFRELSEDEVAKLRAAASRPGGTARARRGSASSAPAAEGDRPSSRSGRPARPAPADAAPGVPSLAADEDESAEETWLAGGGALGRGMDLDDEETDLAPSDEGPGEEAAPEWPARPTRRRGDSAWQAEHSEAPRAAARPRPANSPRKARPGFPARRTREEGPIEGGYQPRSGERAAPRGQRAAPRGGRPKPRGEAPAPRAGRAGGRDFAPRAERSTPRAGRAGGRDFAPRAERPAPRAGRAGGGFASRGERPPARSGRPAPRDARRRSGVSPARRERPEQSGVMRGGDTRPQRAPGGRRRSAPPGPRTTESSRSGPGRGRPRNARRSGSGPRPGPKRVPGGKKSPGRRPDLKKASRRKSR